MDILGSIWLTEEDFKYRKYIVVIVQKEFIRRTVNMMLIESTLKETVNVPKEQNNVLIY